MLAPLRQQATSFWQHQSNSQRITLIILVIAAFIIVPVIVSYATAPNYSVAFSGLSETDAGQIVQKLADGNVPYKLQGTGTILVPNNQVYEVRLMLARAGLPQSGTVGFELFSGNTLGMTEFTQKVNYQRALEGELERTITSLNSVEAARVHLVIPEKTLLADEQLSPTASITIKVHPGNGLDAAQVRSISHLVASSVEGLKPEAISIVDTNGNMLASGSGADGSASTDAEVDTHRGAELSAAKDVEHKVQTMLNSVLGPNNSVVQAVVVMDWAQRQTKSQTYNPTPAAIRSLQKVNEAYTTNGSVTGGIPGASSNLPTPVPTTAGGSGSTVYSRQEETTNYEITQTESQEIQAPGQVKKISLSVMVDGVTDPKQMDTIKSAVAAAAGIDTARGDLMAVETLKFDRTYAQSQAKDLTSSEQSDLYIRIGEAVGAAIILFLLLWYVARLFKNLKMASSEQWTPVMRTVGEASLPMSSSGGLPNASGMLPGSAFQQSMSMPEPEMAQPQIPMPPIPKYELPTRPAGPTPEEEQMQRVMGRITDENPATIADILQIWLNEDENRHG